MNVNKIKGRLVELRLTYKDVGKALNLAPCTVSQKINGIRPLTLDEAQGLFRLLQLDNSDFGTYFFTN